MVFGSEIIQEINTTKHVKKKYDYYKNILLTLQQQFPYVIKNNEKWNINDVK